VGAAVPPRDEMEHPGEHAEAEEDLDAPPEKTPYGRTSAKKTGDLAPKPVGPRKTPLNLPSASWPGSWAREHFEW